MRFALVFAALVFIAQGAPAQGACDLPGVGSCNEGALTWSRCMRSFADSHAARTCLGPSVEIVNNWNCKFRASCPRDNLDVWKWSEVTVRHQRVRTIRNCDGTLKEWSC